METWYAQIEKELLAIIFACDHFEAYIYGQEVETDHVSIVPKPLGKAPSRFQRMSLRIQKYSFDVKFKEGKKCL